MLVLFGVSILGRRLSATPLYLLINNGVNEMKKFKNICLSLLTLFLFVSCSDSLLEPDPQFVQIFFKYEFNNELNTFDKTYQKDLILDGTIKVNFWLTTDEQNQILNKANEINFFSFPDTFLNDTSFVLVSPNPGEQKLRIKTNNKDHQSIWTILIDLSNPQAAKLKELSSLIISIIEAKPEYKKLPPSRGGHI